MLHDCVRAMSLYSGAITGLHASNSWWMGVLKHHWTSQGLFYRGYDLFVTVCFRRQPPAIPSRHPQWKWMQEQRSSTGSADWAINSCCCYKHEFEYLFPLLGSSGCGLINGSPQGHACWGSFLVRKTTTCECLWSNLPYNAVLLFFMLYHMDCAGVYLFCT